MRHSFLLINRLQALQSAVPIMDIENIRARVRRGAYCVTDHAISKGFKEGITVARHAGSDPNRCETRSVPGPTALRISNAVEGLFRAGKELDSTGISFHKIAS
jgi:hypothetical protein